MPVGLQSRAAWPRTSATCHKRQQARTAAALATPSERGNGGCAADAPRVTRPRRDRGAAVATGAASAAALAKGLRLRNARAGDDAEGAASATPIPKRHVTYAHTRTAAHCPAQAEWQRMRHRSPHAWLASRAQPGRRGAHPAPHSAPRERTRVGLWRRVFLYRVAGGAHDVYNWVYRTSRLWGLFCALSAPFCDGNFSFFFMRKRQDLFLYCFN